MASSGGGGGGGGHVPLRPPPWVRHCILRSWVFFGAICKELQGARQPLNELSEKLNES